MSKVAVENIICTHCGKESKVNKYQSINSLLNPELREKLLNNDLTDITCECGKIMRLRYPIIYHKMELEKSIIIQYTQLDIEEAKKDYEEARAFIKKLFPIPSQEEEDVFEAYNDWDKFIERVREIGE